jgi:ComF family protein
VLKNWWTALLDIVYPPRCPACRSAVSVQGGWCSRCLPESVPLRELPPGGQRSAALDICLTIFPYDGAVKHLLHKLKFQPDPKAACYFAWLLENKVNWAKLHGPELVAPVPLSVQRLAKRGFNQTELLFKPWCEAHGYIWADTLVRNRDTLPQWQLSPIERRQNIKGAFAVTQPELVQGKTVLLVDDILTTGYTMAECARTLKKAGAKAVCGLALASGAARW